MVGVMFLITFSYRAFIEQQKSRKIEIVSKILKEKASSCKQKNQQLCTKAIKSGGKCKDSLLWRKKAWRYIEKTCKHPAGALPQVNKGLRNIFKFTFYQSCRKVNFDCTSE